MKLRTNDMMIRIKDCKSVRVLSQRGRHWPIPILKHFRGDLLNAGFKIFDPKFIRKTTSSLYKLMISDVCWLGLCTPGKKKGYVAKDGTTEKLGKSFQHDPRAEKTSSGDWICGPIQIVSSKIDYVLEPNTEIQFCRSGVCWGWRSVSCFASCKW